MGKCFVCRKEKGKLYGGICAECQGEGANISLLSAIQDKDKALVKKIEDRVKEGKIIRLM